MRPSRVDRTQFFLILTLGFLTLSSIPSRAQTAAVAPSSAATPQELAQLVLQRFSTGSLEQFHSVDPDPGSRAVVAAAIQRKAIRKPNLGQVVWSDPQRAVLLLTGTVVDEDSAVETIRSRHFSGFYEAVKSGNAWTLSRQLPFDADNHILAHTIDAVISPGQRIAVKDTVTIVAGSQYGFAVRLNDQAQLSEVKMNGKPVKYEFGGGVLWTKAPPKPNARLFVAYTLAEYHPPAEDKAKAVPSTNGMPDYGSFVNETVWAPVFDFDSANDTGVLDITVRLPKNYFLTTSVPQTDTVQNGMRIVRGHTSEPEFILSLIYDRAWHPTDTKIGNVQFGTFLTPDFRWSSDIMGQQVREVDTLLSRRFGPPQAAYIAVAEQRDLGEGGFRYRTNDLVVAAQGGGKELMTSAIVSPSAPNAPLAHEVSHGWTMQATGPGANFLREGWATYCEWLFVGTQYGGDVTRGIWQTAYNYYILGGHNGIRSVLGNPDNGSIHYVKGAWVLHMLEETMGQSAFDQGMRAYIQLPRNQAAGYQEFIAAMSQAASHDMSPFIMPWLTGKYIPDLDAQVENSKIVVTQKQQDIFSDLPLHLTYETASGAVVERPIHITGKTTTLETGSDGPIQKVRIDPDHQYLLLRHLGENVHFQLRAPSAKSVALAGNFSIKPVPATRNGDNWIVDFPMTDGQYSWEWQIDGKKPDPGASYEGQPITGTRIVKPEQAVTNAYPR